MELSHWIDNNGFDLFVARHNCQAARQAHTPDDLGFIFIPTRNRREAIFVTRRVVDLYMLGFRSQTCMKAFLHQHHDGILFGNSYMSPDNELVPQQHAMVCLDQTWWTRRTQDRNRVAEKVAKRLHFDVLDKGIYGAVTISWAGQLMTWQDAQDLEYALQKSSGARQPDW